MLFFILIALLVVFISVKVLKQLKYWEERKVPHLQPWPIMGNVASMIFHKQSLAHQVQDFYNAFPEERYVGFHQFFHPTLLIRDPELMKQMIVKDFDSFPQHQPLAPEGIDPLWDKNLLIMKGGEKWRDMRSLLSPSFTSSKLKSMFPLMKECAQQFTIYISKQSGKVSLEMKDTFSRFTCDLLGTTALGVVCNSLENRDNELYMMGIDINNFTGIKSILIFLYGLSPMIMKVFRIKMIREKVDAFFRRIVKETIQYREENGIVRPDVINLLLEARHGRLKYDDSENKLDSSFAVVEESDIGKSHKRKKLEITDEDITAQVLIFFVGGLDTTSTLMMFTLYELALNTDVQEKLLEEINQTSQECNGNITYEALLRMKYLDMVITESLRLWPPIEATDRICVKNYTIEPKHANERPLHLEADVNIWIPIYGIHRDPQYFPYPDKFDPERFSQENRHKIKPFSYIPFGMGPRACIGSRFALLETKLIIYEVLRQFQVEPTEKTEIPLQLKKGTIGMLTQNGVWLGFKPRNL